MSYCVHCGVELACERVCPLCATPVIDPCREPSADAAPRFAQRMDVPPKPINRRFLMLLIALVLLFPLLAVVVTDVLRNGGITWSGYVLGAEMCLWSFFVLPFNLPRRPPYLYVTADTVVLTVYVLLIFLSTGGGNWYLRLALPIILLAGAAADTAVLLLRSKRRNRLAKCGWCILLPAALCVALDVLIGYYVTQTPGLSWSWYAALPLLVLGMVVLTFSRSTTLRDWVRRKLFI